MTTELHEAGPRLKSDSDFGEIHICFTINCGPFILYIKEPF